MNITTLHVTTHVLIFFLGDIKYNYNNIWFGIYYERQFEAFLGFPDYFYIDSKGNPTGYSSDKRNDLANNRRTNTLIFSISKSINF